MLPVLDMPAENLVLLREWICVGHKHTPIETS